MTIDEILAMMQDPSDKGKYLVILYTGDVKQGKTSAVNIRTKEKIPVLTFDVIGPVTDPDGDTLKVMNTCEDYGKIAVVRVLQGVQKRFNIFRSYEAWFAERPKRPA